MLAASCRLDDFTFYFCLKRSREKQAVVGRTTKDRRVSPWSHADRALGAPPPLLRSGHIPTAIVWRIFGDAPGFQTIFGAKLRPTRWWWIYFRPHHGRNYFHRHHVGRSFAQDLVRSLEAAPNIVQAVAVMPRAKRFCKSSAMQLRSAPISL